jgi:hypothetical protein
VVSSSATNRAPEQPGNNARRSRGGDVLYVTPSETLTLLEFKLFQLGLLIIFVVKLWRFVRKEIGED